MIFKIVSLFLIGMGVLAMFGKLRVPKVKGMEMLSRKKCPKCGAHRIGKGSCICKNRRG